MAESTTLQEPSLAHDARPRTREGIVVSTVLRLTTTDGERFEDITKAMEHEAYYQILKRLVNELGWPDNEDTAGFARRLSQHFRGLLPLLNQLETDGEALRAHLAKLQRIPPE